MLKDLIKNNLTLIKNNKVKREGDDIYFHYKNELEIEVIKNGKVISKQIQKGEKSEFI